ncbi:hypothetical protein V6N13_023938 [Hibiscus sabdariffa]|uniref:Rep n=1 Tax=Hibiscus sabdariffa TaxID=183260 RepID=A0ABR1ZST5_9ROSI
MPRRFEKCGFQEKYRCTNFRQFDLKHPTNSQSFHGNVDTARSASDAKAYIEKDGVFYEWGTFKVDGRSARTNQQTINDAYAQAINSGCKEEALRIIKELVPRDYLCNYHNLSSNMDIIFKPVERVFEPPYQRSSFNNVPTMLTDWVVENIKDAAARPWRPISLVIEGESRTGKTLWARSLGPHNYLCGQLDLCAKTFTNKAWYNVIDDVDPHFIKHFKEFMGAQRDWKSNTKYGKPVQIKGGIPTIFLCNPGPTSSYTKFLAEEKNKSLNEWAKKMPLSSPSKSHSTPPSIKAQHHHAKRNTRRSRIDLPCGCTIYVHLSCHDYGFTHRGTHHCSSSTEFCFYLGHSKSPLFQDAQLPPKTIQPELQCDKDSDTIQPQPSTSSVASQVLPELHNMDDVSSVDYDFLSRFLFPDP